MSIKDSCYGTTPGAKGDKGGEDPQITREETGAPEMITETPRRTRILKTITAVATLFLLAVSLTHVLVVFLHVAPANSVSQRYNKQINAWVYPLFEQNWRLFAPNPESVNYRISARTMRTSADGTQQVSDWFDLSAVDESAVRHSVFPSHTEQNMLRRAWSSYLELHGGDDQPHSRRAWMMQQYLSNISAQRVAAHRHGSFEDIQLRVTVRPVPTSAGGAGSRPAAAPAPDNTRYLPWWKATWKVAPYAG